jgi:hypothetical protein
VSVDPSSLIFAVIIGIWAVYLVQHWVRRREQLATSRSVDRFSAAMRILERRAPIPVALPAGQSQNRAYVVASAAVRTPARVSASAGSAGSSTGSSKGSSKAGDSRPEVAMSSHDRAQSTASRSAPPAPGAAAGGASASRPTRTVVPRRTHRVRAVILLTLLVGTPAVWAAHVFGTLLLWPTVTVTVLFVVDLMLVRSAARHEAAARRRISRRPAARSAATRRPAAHTRAGNPAQTSARTAAKTFPAAASMSLSTRSTPAASSSTSALPVGEVRPMHSQDAITEVIVLDGGWEPVAVPPPTYTMKAKADRPAESRAPMQADSESAPSREPLVPAVAVDELDLDSVLDRRRAAGE